MASARILIVEDELLVAKSMKLSLQNMGHEVLDIVPSGEEAVQRAEEMRPDIVLMDIQLQGRMDGIEAATIIRSHLDVPIVYTTAYADGVYVDRARATEPFGFITKPAAPFELRATIETALYKHDIYKQLQASERKYRDLVELANSIIIKCDLEGRLTFVNQYGQRYFGYSEEDLLGKHIVGILSGQTDSTALDDSALLAAMARSPNEPINCETGAIRPDRTSGWVSWTSRAITDEEGRTTGLLAVGNDITRLKETERALKTSEERFRAVFESTSDCILVWDREHNYLYANRASIEHVGTTPDKVIGRNIKSGLGHIPDFMHLWVNRVDRVFETGEGMRVEDASTVGDRLVFSESVLSPIRDPHGDIFAVGVVYRDVSERKRIEHALRESEDRYRDLFDLAPVPLFLQDCSQVKLLLDGLRHIGVRDLKAHFRDHPEDLVRCANLARIVAVNERAVSFFGLNLDEGLPEGVAEFFVENTWDALADEVIALFAGQTWHEGEFAVITRDGEVKTVMANVAVLKGHETAWDRMLVSFLDITDRKQAEERLNRSETMLRLVLDSIPSRVFWKDERSVYLGCNRGFLDDVGLDTLDEVIGKTDDDLPWKRYAGRYQRDDRHVMESGTTMHIGEEPFQRTDGSQAIARTSKVPLVDPIGKTFGVLGIYQDITEQKQTEMALQRSEDRYRALFNGSPAGIMLADANSREFRYANPALCRMLGYTADELSKMSVPDIHPDYALQSVTLGFDSLATGSKKLVPEVPCLTKDGRVLLADIHAGPLYLDGTLYVIGFFADVTERTRIRHELGESEERYRNLVESMHEGLFVIDRDENITYVNRRFAEMIRSDRSECIGRNRLSFIDESLWPVAVEQFYKLRKGHAISHEFKLVTKDGSRIPAIVSSQPLFGQDGSFAGAFSILTDISERQQMEERLKQSLEEKTVLLREIHHRVKNNLAVISSLLSLHSDLVTDETAIRMFRECEARVRSMALVHQGLFRSENLATLNMEEYVVNLVNLIVSFSDLTGTDREVQFDVENIPFELDTAMPLGFILTELISNCMKHAFVGREKGLVKISLRRIGENCFEIVVRDDGVGMPAGLDINNLKSLGLDLVATFVRQLAGSWEVRVDGGTEVRVTFGEILCGT